MSTFQHTDRESLTKHVSNDSIQTKELLVIAGASVAVATAAAAAAAAAAASASASA